jgi:hypothetical protein
MSTAGGKADLPPALWLIVYRERFLERDVSLRRARTRLLTMFNSRSI